MSQTRIHVKRQMSQSALFLQQGTPRRPTQLGLGQRGWWTLAGHRSVHQPCLSSLWGRERVCWGGPDAGCTLEPPGCVKRCLNPTPDQIKTFMFLNAHHI